MDTLTAQSRLRPSEDSGYVFRNFSAPFHSFHPAGSSGARKSVLMKMTVE
jgi:hypothetical protein